MKKIIVSLIVLMFCTMQSGHAQSQINTSLFNYNQGMYNPAATGLNSENLIIANFRISSLFHDIKPIDVGLGYERLLNKERTSLGVYYYLDKVETITNTNTIGFSAAHKVWSTNDLFLKLGIQFNVIRHFVNLSGFTPFQDGDPCWSGANKDYGVNADINLGLWFHWKNLDFGASVINVIRPTIIKFDNGGSCSGIGLPRFFISTMAYNIKLSESFLLKPSIYYFDDFNHFDFSTTRFGVDLSYQDFINLGAFYATNNVSELTFIAGVKLLKFINLQFSYSFFSNSQINVHSFESLSSAAF